MIFSNRVRLAEDYEKWLKINNEKLKKEGCKGRIQDCPLSVITFLDNKGYLGDAYFGKEKEE